jgi:hypothetical protein
VDCTTADASISAGDYTFVDHRVEGYNWLPLTQRIVTLSFWVKGTKTGIHCVSLINSGADRSCVKEFTINTTATWEKKTLTFPVSPSAGTWDYTTGIGIYIRFALAAGSTFQTTADAYQTGNFFATSNQVNATDDTANDFRLCGVQLEAGSVATEVEQRTFPEELALCERYYEKSYEYAVVPGTAVTPGAMGWYVQNISAPFLSGMTVVFKTRKRITPTTVSYSPNSGTAGKIFDSSAAADQASTVFGGSEASVGYYAITTAAGPISFAYQWTASAEL